MVKVINKISYLDYLIEEYTGSIKLKKFAIEHPDKEEEKNRRTIIYIEDKFLANKIKNIVQDDSRGTHVQIKNEDNHSAIYISTKDQISLILVLNKISKILKDYNEKI
jgi:hypothetical protein